jgi:hypothetical protein
MPLIVADFSSLARVGFNLFYCFEIPSRAFEAEEAGNKREAGKNGVDGT